MFYTPAQSPAFSTTLYPGNGGTQQVSTGVDNTGKSLVWVKNRTATFSYVLTGIDLIDAGYTDLASDSIDGAVTHTNYVTSLSSNGFSVGNSSSVNNSSQNYVAWNFRAAPGFFDIVTWTGDSVNGRQITHDLGSTPGCIIVKNTNLTGGSADGWYVWHRDISTNDIDAPNNLLRLNLDNALFTGTNYLANAQPTTFTVGNLPAVNTTGNTYIAYLFADTAGLIKCGSFIIPAGGPDTTVECGFKPQWVMMKNADQDADWQIMDAKRGFSPDNIARGEALFPNNNVAEAGRRSIAVTNTGFIVGGFGTGKCIYVAIAEDANAGDFIPTGIVAEKPNTTNRTLKLNNTVGNWDDSTGFNTTIPASGAGGTWDSYTGSVATVSGTTGRWIGANAGSKAFSIAPVDGITEQTAEVYCAMQIIDDKAEVMGIQTTDPGFLNVTAKDYTIEFPALFTSGEAPDTALPAGTAITATVKAENTVGASVRESNTFIPQLIAPEGSAGPITGSTETVLTVGSSANLSGFVANDSLVMVDDTGAVASYTPTTTAITNVVTVDLDYTTGITTSLAGTATINSGTTVDNIFDGDLSSRWRVDWTSNGTGSGGDFTLASSLTATQSVRVLFVCTADTATITVGTESTTTPPEVGGGRKGWVTIPITTPFTFNKVGFRGSINNSNASIYAVEVDGVVLENGSQTTLTLTDNQDLAFLKSGDLLTSSAVTGLTPAMSTTLYSGNDTNRTITSGINNTTKSLVWIKSRGPSNFAHNLFDTLRGEDWYLQSNQASQQFQSESSLTAFNNNGFDVGSLSTVNASSSNFVAWNFRAAPGFFDIQTWDGDDSTDRDIPHLLATTCGLVIVKCTNVARAWRVWHKDLQPSEILELNAPDGAFVDTSSIISADSTSFKVSSGATVNSSDGEYVAYLFADTPGTIKCGSFTTTAGNPTITTGFRVGWVMYKSLITGNWTMFDSDRGFNKELYANESSAESSAGATIINITDTGFTLAGAPSANYIYIAIAEDATATGMPNTGTLTADADTVNNTVNLSNVSGTWAATQTSTGPAKSGVGNFVSTNGSTTMTIDNSNNQWIDK